MFLCFLFCCVSRHTALYPELLTCSGAHFRKPIDTKTVLLWAAEAYARILCIFERMYANVRILTCGELARGRGKACSARVWADWGWSIVSELLRSHAQTDISLSPLQTQCAPAKRARSERTKARARACEFTVSTAAAQNQQT